ncbi:MAG TPA: NAD(P)/FAD-dependent oxidoreductase [Phycicoccus sp.]
MPTIPVVVVGAGPAGLAVSHELAGRGVDHVVLDRGRTAESWRSRRWDSLRLLSPAWATRLPGLPAAADPDAFLSAGALVDLLTGYAAGAALPVVERAEVLSVRPRGSLYRIVSTGGTWLSRAVVVATGDSAVPAVPTLAASLPRSVVQLTTAEYRRPEQVPDGPVLVVGASASGVQLADELAAAGRDVVLAVGRHTRMVRSYRGMDIYWWLDQLGSLDRHVDTVPDRAVALREPSPQLVGHAGSAGDERDVSLTSLASRGVRLVGRVVGADGSHVAFDEDLAVTTAAADARLARFLRRVDDHIAARGLDEEFLDAGPRPAPVHVPATPTRLSVSGGGFRTVLWATGYRRSDPWLERAAPEAARSVLEMGRAASAPGLYVVGRRWQSRRSSGLLAGIGADARLVTAELVRRLPRTAFSVPHRRPLEPEPRS